jgi:glucose-1-phosphate cytidylyltransferase
MKTVILCGGMGTRLSEETSVRPKPMVEIGGRPILWHVMKTYERHGFKDFVLALGYKGSMIKDYFLNYHRLTSDVTVRLKSGKASYGNVTAEDWTVSMYDTGLESLTGGRLFRLKKHLKGAGTFMLTYGDGVADVDVRALLKFHKKHGKIATVTSVRPPSRFGTMVMRNGHVVSFKEKPQLGEGWINGGYMAFEQGVFDYLDDERTVLEGKPLEKLAKDGQLMAFRHEGFWQPMDTMRDKNYLEGLCANGSPPWLK